MASELQSLLSVLSSLSQNPQKNAKASYIFLFKRMTVGLSVYGGYGGECCVRFLVTFTLKALVINLNYIQRSSPYRAVNTVHLCYKNQSVNAV